MEASHVQHRRSARQTGWLRGSGSRGHRDGWPIPPRQIADRPLDRITLGELVGLRAEVADEFLDGQLTEVEQSAEYGSLHLIVGIGHGAACGTSAVRRCDADISSP
jgi:hypothetical protein